MFLASHAFQAGSLAASQPGLTVVDPLVASLLGVVLFGERLVLEPVVLAGELVALLLLVGSVVLLSRSPLIRGEEAPKLARRPPTSAPRLSATTASTDRPATAQGISLFPQCRFCVFRGKTTLASGAPGWKPLTWLGSLEDTLTHVEGGETATHGPRPTG